MSDALQKLLARVEAVDIRLWVDDGRLRYDAPEGALTPDLAAALRERRAELIEHLRHDAVSLAERPPIRPRSAADGAPLSFAQQRLWFLDQLGTGPAYNVPLVTRLSGALDVTALKAALCAIIARHEVLRTSFPSENGQPVQRIAPTLELPFESVDLRHLEPDEREPRAHQMVDEDVLHPFDLGHGPLMRCRLYRLDDDHHVFVLTFHHVIIDAWSIGLFQRELSELYRALRAGEAPRLRELSVQYADFSIWQREWLQGETLEAQLGYWRDQLGPEVPVLQLPLDRVRPRVQSFAAAEHRFRLPSNVMSALETLGARQGATPAMTLLAAFNMLLAQDAGQDDVVVGVPVANRGDIAIEDLIGFFVNTLAIRTDLSGDPTFKELLARVRDASAGAYDHQDVPFDVLVDDLKPERDPSRNPLFQVMCVVQRASGEDLVLPGIAVRPFVRRVEMTRFDLEVHMGVDEGGLLGRLIYKTDLFDDATITRMAGRFRMLLEAIAANPEVRRSELRWLTKEEREQVVLEWNRTDRELAPGVCLHELFEAQVQRTPDAAALEFDGETLSYRELNERANRVARYLRSRGAGPDRPVGICVERSIEMVVGVLGVLKAGAGYLPLDSSYPEDRLAYMVGNARTQIVLTQTSLRSKIDALGGGTDGFDVVDLHGDWPTIAQQPADDLGVPVDPGDLAYAIYTSGSTGRPKGVAMPHRPLVNLVQWHKETLGDGPEARTVQFAPFSFDVSFQEIFTTLGVGGTLILISEDLRRDAAALLSLLREQSVTRLFAPFVALRQLADVAQEVSELPASLCDVITAGEQLQVTPALVALFKRLPGCRLHNHYGPSETHLVTALTLEGSPETWPALPTIGRPIANTRIYLLDEFGQPVPIGVPGELYIGGTAVSDGYLHAPDLTAERFVPDPFDVRSAGRLYRTGDRARYLSDGVIEFLGRVDHQVKLRGYRIEPAEVESLLTEHADVRQAIAMVREDRVGHRRLVSYVVGTPGRVPSPAELKSWMKGRVPEYMVPAAFVTLDALPLTPSGKVDRRKLPALDGTMLGVGTEYVAPRSGTEEVLCSIWADVLGIDRVGVHDDFFDLGGHSLLATQVVSRVRQVCEVELPLQSLFDDPTVERLAAVVQGVGVNAPHAPPIVPLPRDGDLPLSFAQQRLWFLDELHQGSAGYNLPISLRLRGELDRDALQRSLDELVRRHETLRTTFRSRDGVPWQSILAPAPVAVRLVDMTDRPAETREAAAQQTVQHEVSQPFDLSAGAPMRALLMRLADDEHVLLLTLHHIVTDGWSFGVLKREFGAIYAAFTQGEPSPLAPLAIQYADFGVWQRERLDGALGAEQLQYWKSELAELSPLELPTDHPRPAKQTFRAGRVQLVLPKDLSNAIDAVSRTSGATPFMTLLAAFSAMLGRYAGQDDIVVGTPIANRNHVDIEPLVGFFVNTLVMRTDLSGQPTFQELVSRVRRTALGAYAHQDLPFEHLVEDLHPERDLARSPIFQVLFAMQNVDATALTLPGLETSAFPIEVGSTRLDLELWVAQADDELVANVVYNADLFDATTIERMSRHYHNLLEAIVADPDQLVDSLAILDQAERDDLVVARNRTEAKVAELSVPELVHRTAADRPDATAVVFEDVRLTYAQLDAQAGRLAGELLGLGVGRGDRVGLCVDRSPAMLIGLLGVQKTGAAYVPLDPGLPAERLRFMLEDAGVAAIVTTDAVRERLAIIAEHDAPIASLDAIRLSKPSAAETDLPRVRPDDVAYVIYTSGSTGRPKGVEVLHRGVVNFLESMRVEPGFDENDVLLAVTTLSFDIAVLELLLPLSCGGTVVIAPAASVSDGETVGRLLDEHGVTVLQATPATWQLLLQSGWSGRPNLTMLCGGEALPRPLADALLECGGELWNMYGPTETTIWSAILRVDRDPDASPGPVSIGRPIANTQLYVLDAEGRFVPDGAVGELCIGGHGVARGYWRRPELTAERFVPDPFRDERDARIYRTGDLVRYDAQGRLQFLGRTDHQVKLRGFRIELGEIESALVGHSAVEQATVLLRDGGAGDQRLVAYIVADRDVRPATLRAHLSETLPDYMVPGTFVHVDAMPLSPAGKVDREMLLAIEPAVVAEGGDEVAPRGPVEESVAALFAELLDCDRVGAHDGFFELGGHSLLGTQLVARLRKIFEIDLALSVLFESPTVAQLAERVEAARRHGAGATGRKPIVPISRETDDLPLSFAEQRLWFLDQMGTGAGYNMTVAIRASGAMDVAILDRSLAAIAERHEVLSTTFPADDGKPRVAIADTANLSFEVIDRTGLQADDRDTAIEDYAREEADAPFDLGRGPLARTKLIRLADDDHVILVTLHHIIGDGWSVGVFARELMAHYRAYADGGEPEVPALPIQYLDFAAWQRDWLEGDELERQLAYWREQLRDLPVLGVPTDRPRPSVPTFAGADCRFHLSPELVQGVHTLARREGVTPAMFLLAAFQVLLARYSGQEDIVVGSPIANRVHPDLENLIGFFVNSLVLRADLSGDPTFVEVLRRVRSMSLGAYDHQDLPFERLVDEIEPKRDPSRNPLFQVAFLLQNMPAVGLEVPDLALQMVPLEVRVARVDLEMHLFERDGGIIGRAIYSTDLFDETTISRMLRHYERLLESAVAAPATRISAMALLKADERRLLLDTWNETQAPFADDRCIHELFEARVAEVPDTVAVAAGDVELMYAELNARANQVAHGLRARGVGPDMLVGVCTDRNPAMIVGMLGILKSGGGYLPLDPTYPRERLAHMFEDSGVRVLLTQSPLLESLPPFDGEVLCLDRDWSLFAEESTENPTVVTCPDNLAYAIYTSGSTGRPKGVLLQHRGLCNLAMAQIDAFRITRQSRVLQFAAMSFDASVSEVFTALGAGATLCLAPKSDLIPGMDFVRLLEDRGITTVTVPPSVLAALPDADVPALATLVSAGEPCSGELVRGWGRNRRFLNAYGPTETTVCATIGRCDPDDDRTPSIGRQMANVATYVLDALGHPVPVGVIGELFIGGPGIARGYLNRPALTAERFVPDQFSGAAGGRLYRTGDLARYRADGTLEYVGRADHQVKVHGFRIELGEIEETLRGHSEVRDAVVVVRETERDGLAGGHPTAEDELELWPSLAEFFVYDDLAYHAMTHDERRNVAYRQAIDALVKDKVVLDIGTGADAILSRFCVDGGARKIYAIEILEESYRHAQATIARLGLQDRIHLIHGDSRKVELPEPIDVCVSEIVGAIGGSEGAAAIINDAWRFMKPGGVMIPDRSTTMIAAVGLPDSFLANPVFGELSARYVEKIFEQVGYRFDLRLCLKNMTRDGLASSVDVFEDLDYMHQIELEASHPIELRIEKDTRISGFLVWLNLQTMPNCVIDILDHEYCWLPVFLPVFHPQIDVSRGDVIEAGITRTLAENELNPDFRVTGVVKRAGAPDVEFDYVAHHFDRVYRGSPFYRELFRDDTIPVGAPLSARRDPAATAPDRRLVAYVTADPSGLGGRAEDDHVAQWQTLYDESYAANQDPAEAAFNIAGWNSSYTGEPIPPEQMRIWVDNTVARIRSTGPERVLEMGCGSGLLLLNLVPDCAEYVGADFSQPALDYVAKQLARMGADGAKGRVECRTADNFEGLPRGHFDTVVLNSVVQYFPDADYLRRVLDGAVAAVRPGGRIFVGDVRNLPLLGAFHASVQLERTTGETTSEQLRRRVHHEMNQDQELVIDPSFFTTLVAEIDGISHVELEPKRGRYDNELSRFRYDVIVHVAGGAANGSTAELDWRTWNDAEMTLLRLRTMLAEEQPSTLALAEVPNRRVAADVWVAAMLDGEDAPERADALRAEGQARSNGTLGVEPDDLRSAAEELGYDVHLSLTAARPDGSYDVVLARHADGVPPDGIWRAMPAPVDRERGAEPTNKPLRGRFLRELVPQLREHASARLPEYMVPSVFTVMDRLPLTPNGKVDRRALPAPDALRPELAVAYEAPRSEQEETLARIWVQVLGVDRVGAHDNFFELGGDSMLSIQVVALAREAGIGISARDLFQLQTVAELAAAAGAATATAEQGVVTGDVRLTPIMKWFFEQDLTDAHHFNQAFMIAAETPFDASEVEAVLGHLAAHHDALRLRARHADEGWTLTLVEPGDRIPVDVVDLSAVAPAEQPALVEREAARVQASLDLENGPLVRCAIFRGGASDDGAGERLLIVVHHLAVDVVSWGVLLDDLARGIKQRRAGEPWSLPPKTTSIREWASRLDEHAQSAEVAADAAHWSGLPWSKAGAFPVDHAQGPNTIGSVRSVPVVLDEEQTRAVLNEVPGAFNATVEDVLLAALAIACAAEMKSEWTLVDLEGHGREEFADDLDVSRTVGWFTSIHPVLLQAEPGAGAGAVMRTVKEQLRAVPGNGTAFGLARYLARDAGLSDRMRAVPDAPIAFNYLGRLDQMTNRDEWNVSTRDTGPSRSPHGVRKHLLEVSGSVLQGQLRMGFAYSSAVHQGATIKRLADRYVAALAELIEASRTGEDRGYTASDLAEVGWNVEDVTDLLEDLEGNL